MTASYSCERALPDFRDDSEVCLIPEGKREEEETGRTDRLTSLSIAEGEGKEEVESNDELASLVTTAAATWCYHALPPQKTDALLRVFQQLLGTHHTVYEPAPPLLTDQSFCLASPLESAETTTVESIQQKARRSTKREDAYTQAAAAMASQQDRHMQQPVVQEQSTRVSDGEREASSMWTPSVSIPQEDPTIRPINTGGCEEASDLEEDKGDTIPYFPLLKEILQSNWKDEGAKKGKTRKKKKGKKSDARVPDVTFINSTGQTPKVPMSSGDSSAQHATFVPDTVQPSYAPECNGLLPAFSYDASSLNHTGRTPLQTISTDEQHNASFYSVVDNTEELHSCHQQQNVVCASQSDGVTATAATSQWKITFTCRVCGRNDTIEENSAKCSTCIIAQNVQQAQSETQHTVTDKSSPGIGFVSCGTGRQAGGVTPASSSDTSNRVDNASTIPSTEKMKNNKETTRCFAQSTLPLSTVKNTRNVGSGNRHLITGVSEEVSPSVVPSADEDSLFSDLLLPPAVPVSSALKRTSPDAVRLWRLRARRRSVLHGTADSGEICCGNTNQRGTNTDVHYRQTATGKSYAGPHDLHANVGGREEFPCNEYDDHTEVVELLRMVQPRKFSAERRKRIQEDDIHVRAQLACLVDAHEVDPVHAAERRVSQTDAANGTAKRPEARQLVSAVVSALKKVPKHEREDEALLELLMSWYYAGFFTGRLSM